MSHGGQKSPLIESLCWILVGSSFSLPTRNLSIRVYLGSTFQSFRAFNLLILPSVPQMQSTFVASFFVFFWYWFYETYFISCWEKATICSHFTFANELMRRGKKGIHFHKRIYFPDAWMVLHKTTLKEKVEASSRQKDVKFCPVTAGMQQVWNQPCKASLQRSTDVIGKRETKDFGRGQVQPTKYDGFTKQFYSENLRMKLFCHQLIHKETVLISHACPYCLRRSSIRMLQRPDVTTIFCRNRTGLISGLSIAGCEFLRKPGIYLIRCCQRLCVNVCFLLLVVVKSRAVRFSCKQLLPFR